MDVQEAKTRLFGVAGWSGTIDGVLHLLLTSYGGAAMWKFEGGDWVEVGQFPATGGGSYLENLLRIIETKKNNPETRKP